MNKYYRGTYYNWWPPDPRLMKNGRVMCPNCLKHEAELSKILGVQKCKWCQADSQGIRLNLKGKRYHVPDRIKKQQETHYPDFVQPHIYDKTLKRNVINPDFVKFYPEKAHLYYTPTEIKKAGYPRLIGYSEGIQRNEKAQKEQIERYKEKMIQLKQSGNPADFLKKLTGRQTV